MRYLEKTFTLPTTARRMTDEEYAVAVGLKIPTRKHDHSKGWFNSGCPKCMEEYGRRRG